MAEINVNIEDTRLPHCPRCDSKLSYITNPILNLLRITQPRFHCDFCGWKKTKKQVQIDGGLNPPQRDIGRRKGNRFVRGRKRRKGRSRRKRKN
jgi:hypothetical protein